VAEKPTEKSSKPRPNVRQRRVARKLREWRVAADPAVSQDQLAKSLGWSPAKLNRFENCTVVAPVAEVIAIATMLGIPDAERDRVVAYSRAGLEGDVWWRAYESAAVPDYAHDYLETEAFAAGIRTMQQIVPGLLQSPRFTDQLTRLWLPDASETTLAEQRRMRQQRQKRLDDTENPLELHAIIPEQSVLRQLVGSPEVMVEEFDLIIARAQQANVLIQVLPAERGAYPGLGSSYSCLQFRDGDTADTEALYLENFSSGMFVEEPGTVTLYNLNHERLATRDWALDRDASLERLVAIREEWASMT
jgi:hypothetical protein